MQNQKVVSISELEGLSQKLNQERSLPLKCKLLEKFPKVEEFLKKHPKSLEFVYHLSDEERLVILSMIALNQGDLIVDGLESPSFLPEIKDIMKVLLKVEHFYEEIGGIIGYHLKVLELAQPKVSTGQNVSFHKPLGHDLSKERSLLNHLVLAGLEALNQIAQIFVVGGAGDRLMLLSERGELLPAAKLSFMGRTLLEGLFRDLQGEEYLYFKLLATQVTVPVIMMSSQEKNNYQYILEMCEKANWFGRDPKKIRIFCQPLVPVITEDGRWSFYERLKLTLKPGGHGVLWKLLEELKIFDWLKDQGIRRAIVRQINNPIGGTDSGLLGLLGAGFEGNKSFGFLSCDRLLNSSEGMCVLIERKKEEGFDYHITNVEYTDFLKRGIKDQSKEKDSSFSIYPSNTNILFIDLEKIQKALFENPFPGLLVNMKNEAPYFDEQGTQKTTKAGRLETTMQNIADVLIDHLPQKITTDDFDNVLKTFILYQPREKTISVAKKSYVSGSSIEETPIGAFYTLLENHRALLRDYCLFNVPPSLDRDSFIEKGPNLITSFHPALGPLWSIIAQKIRKGNIKAGSEINLEIADIDLENLYLSGSLLIEATSPCGHFNQSKFLEYSHRSGKCSLKEVRILNRGCSNILTADAWKNQPVRAQSLKITLEGMSEFYAENVTFEGAHEITVPDGFRMIAHEENGTITYTKEAILGPSWYWHYAVSENQEIVLKRVNNSSS